MQNGRLDSRIRNLTFETSCWMGSITGDVPIGKKGTSFLESRVWYLVVGPLTGGPDVAFQF